MAETPLIMKPTSPLVIFRMGVECPLCGEVVEYEVQEDDAGAFGPVDDWPICERCDVLIDVAHHRLAGPQDRWDRRSADG